MSAAAAPRRGRLITFEGGEGAGKSTQSALLARALRDAGIAAERTREPGGSPGAEAIRAVLLSGAVKSLGPDVEAVLFAAARAEHLDRRIRPALAAGRWVVCDRFSDSTRVYQGLAGADLQFVDDLEAIAVGDTRPDLTLVLDVPADIGLGRAAARRNAGEPADRFERDPASVHRDRRAAFLALAKREPRRCAVIDATAAPEVVAATVRETVAQRLAVTFA